MERCPTPRIVRRDNSRDNKRPAICAHIVSHRGKILASGRIGQFEPPLNEVEGLVTRIGRGGSNPLGRIEKTPATSRCCSTPLWAPRLLIWPPYIRPLLHSNRPRARSRSGPVPIEDSRAEAAKSLAPAVAFRAKQHASVATLKPTRGGHEMRKAPCGGSRQCAGRLAVLDCPAYGRVGGGARRDCCDIERVADAVRDAASGGAAGGGQA
jgi:hypothetical protein